MQFSPRPSLARTGLAFVAPLAAVALATPAANAAVKVPAGCTFDSTNGTTSCVTTSSSTQSFSAPNSTSGPTSDGSPWATFCLGKFPTSPQYQVDSVNSNTGSDDGYGDISVETASTTSTTYRGTSTGKGNKPISSSSQITSTTYTVGDGTLVCVTPYGLAAYSAGSSVTVTG